MDGNRAGLPGMGDLAFFISGGMNMKKIILVIALFFIINPSNVFATMLLNTTFSNHEDTSQSYPGNFYTNNSPWSGAVGKNILGYSIVGRSTVGDSVYSLIFFIADISSSISFHFTGSNLQELTDESWGLDNVKVEIKDNKNISQVYFNDFQTAGSYPEWDNNTVTTAPNNSTKFLGRFEKGTVNLSFDNLPAHTEIILSFDLYIIQSWDGNGEMLNGPDYWSLSYGDTSAVPLPSAVILLGAGLGRLVLYRRRKQTDNN